MMAAKWIVLNILAVSQVVIATPIPTPPPVERKTPAIFPGPSSYFIKGTQNIPPPLTGVPYPVFPKEPSTDSTTYPVPLFYTVSTSKSPFQPVPTTDHTVYTDYSKDTDMTTSVFQGITHEETKSPVPYPSTLETSYLHSTERPTSTTTSSPLPDTSTGTSYEITGTNTIKFESSTSDMMSSTETSSKPTEAATSTVPSAPQLYSTAMSSPSTQESTPSTQESTSSGVPTKYLSTSKSTDVSSTKQITTSKSFTSPPVPFTTTAPKMTLEEILAVFSGIEHERYFQRLPLVDRVAIYELAAGVQAHQIKEVLDHIGHERLLTLIYNLPMKFIEPLLAYLIQIQEKDSYPFSQHITNQLVKRDVYI